MGATGERMGREMGDVWETISSERPLRLVCEDLHWVDPFPLDLISSLARCRGPGKGMLIGTYRPLDVTLAHHPLKMVKQDLLHQLCREISLEPLTEDEVGADPAIESPSADLPGGLAGVIYQHRRRVLKAASVTGVSFTANANAIGTTADQENFESGACKDLPRRQHRVRRPGSRQFPDGAISQCCEFAHALYREVFYRRQAPASRARLRLEIGETVAEVFPLSA